MEAARKHDVSGEAALAEMLAAEWLAVMRRQGPRKAKELWHWLRLYGYHRRQGSPRLAQLAAHLDESKSERVRPLLEWLKAQGLADYAKIARGRVEALSINLPAREDGPRRHSHHRETAELPGEDWHGPADEAQREASEMCVRMPPPADVPAAAHPAPKTVPKIGDSFGDKSGAFATTTSTTKEKLSLTSTSCGIERSSHFSRGGSVKVPKIGDKTGAAGEQAMAIGGVLGGVADRLLAGPAPFTVAGLAKEFPGLPAANYGRMVHEAYAGGRGFGHAQLDECVRATRDKQAAGQLTGAPCFFLRGAVQRKFRRAGIPWFQEPA